MPGYFALLIAAAQPKPERYPSMLARRSRIALGADGLPLIGALRHSVGGYTVLALAGGKPVRSRIRSTCFRCNN